MVIVHVTSLSSPVSIASPRSPQLANLRRAERRGGSVEPAGWACFQRDRDVLLASPEFARLCDVTQVMAPGGIKHYEIVEVRYV